MGGCVHVAETVFHLLFARLCIKSSFLRRTVAHPLRTTASLVSASFLLQRRNLVILVNEALWLILIPILSTDFNCTTDTCILRCQTSPLVLKPEVA